MARLAHGKRSQYLQAMGIQTWSLRQPLATEPDEPEATLETVVKPVPESPPEQTPVVAEVPTPAPVGEVPTTPQVSIDPIPDWKCLEVEVKACIKCELSKQRTQTVFGVGNRDADLMVIGEAPGADEDAQGEPFVGRAGQLLNQMLLAVGLKREQVYIANIVKCRPPNNRDPRPEEAAACEAYLKQQIALIRPKVILAVGRVAAQNLLKTEQKVGSMRGQGFTFGEQNIPVVVTYHPAYLLRSPSEKRKAWQDLLRARDEMNLSQ